MIVISLSQNRPYQPTIYRGLPFSASNVSFAGWDFGPEGKLGVLMEMQGLSQRMVLALVTSPDHNNKPPVKQTTRKTMQQEPAFSGTNAGYHAGHSIMSLQNLVEQNEPLSRKGFASMTTDSPTPATNEQRYTTNSMRAYGPRCGCSAGCQCGCNEDAPCKCIDPSDCGNHSKGERAWAPRAYGLPKQTARLAPDGQRIGDTVRLQGDSLANMSKGFEGYGPRTCIRCTEPFYGSCRCSH